MTFKNVRFNSCVSVPAARMIIGLSVMLFMIAGSFAYSIRVDNKHLNLTNRSTRAAGADFDCSLVYESSENASTISVAGFSEAEKWDVSARTVLTGAGANDLVLYIRRTSGGTGTGLVTGGTGWTRIERASTRLFSGSGELKDIGIQIRTEGNSTSLPPGNLKIKVDYSLSVRSGK